MINQNGEITKKVKENFGLSELTGYPRRVSEAILPVVNVNERITTIVIEETRTTAGSLSLPLGNANKDFYITGAYLCLAKDAANDTATQGLDLRIYVGGKQLSILTLPVITLTAQNLITQMSFPYPIKADRNTSMTSGGILTGAGKCILSGGVMGYYVENTGN